MEKTIQTLTLFSVLLIFPELTRAQLPEEDLHDYMSGVRSGQRPPLPISTLNTDSTQAFLPHLQAYLNDSLPTVRAAAADIVHFVSINASDPSDRMLGVDLLLQTYREGDAAQNATRLTYLQTYTQEDFSSSARNTVRDLVRREPAYLDRIMRLAGFLQLRDLIPDIRPWTQPGNPSTIRWSALISMARLADATAIAVVLKRATSLPLNDDVVYQLFPDLIFTRSPQLIAHVVEALHQDQPNCLAADPEREVPIDCGYRIMEQLAPIIKDFPIESDESGDLKTDNYPEALESTRLWFRANPGYTILDQSW